MLHGHCTAAALKAPTLLCLSLLAIAAMVSTECYGQEQSALGEGASPALLESENPHEQVPAVAGYLALRSGVAAFGFTQSITPAHGLRPWVRLEGGVVLGGGLELGVELAGVVAQNHNYRLLGAMLVGRAAAYRGNWYELWVGWGAGVGNSPRIGHRDLVVAESAGLWVSASIQNRFVISRSFGLGIDLGADNMSVIHALMALRVQL